MRFKFLSLFAAALLLGACESTPEEDTMTNTGGSTSSGTSTIQTESVAPGSQEDLTVNVGDRVFFAYDSSEISAEAQGTLQQLSAWLNKYPQVVLQVHLQIIQIPNIIMKKHTQKWLIFCFFERI